MGDALAPVLTVVSTQIAFFCHDAEHRQVTRSRGAREALGRLSGNLLHGPSSHLASNKHIAHQAHPNDLTSDHDLGAWCSM